MVFPELYCQIQALHASPRSSVKQMSKSLKEIQENTVKQVREINKTVQGMKMEIEAMTKTQTEGILEMYNLGKSTGTKDASITIEYK